MAQIQVPPGILHLMFRSAVQPADESVVVMSAGIDHTIFDMVVRQKSIVRTIKGKFQHLHAGIAGILQQLFHPGSHHAKILSYNLQISQLLVELAEELDSGALLPFPVDGSFFLGRHRPVLIESPEMVNAHHVVGQKGAADPLVPPGIAGFLVFLPAVTGVAPKLTGFREIVRRHSRHQAGTAVLVKAEQLRVAPGIGTVPRHIDGNIAK